MKYRILLLLAVYATLTMHTACYSLKSTAIPTEVNTFFVQTFGNRALIVVPNLAVDFSEQLREKVRRESRLNYTDTDPDVTFSGYISTYAVTPRAVSQDGAGNLSDLELGVTVSYEMKDNEEESWENTFSFAIPVESSTNLLEVQEGVLSELTEQLTEDIFNKAFNNW